MFLSVRCQLILISVFFFAGASEFVLAQTDARKPAAIETQDVPVIPTEIFTKLAQYQSVRGATFRGWAPDGTGILINTRFGNSSQLHRVYQPAGRREQITFFDEPLFPVRPMVRSCCRRMSEEMRTIRCFFWTGRTSKRLC